MKSWWYIPLYIYVVYNKVLIAPGTCISIALEKITATLVFAQAGVKTPLFTSVAATLRPSSPHGSMATDPSLGGKVWARTCGYPLVWIMGIGTWAHLEWTLGVVWRALVGHVTSCDVHFISAALKLDLWDSPKAMDFRDFQSVCNRGVLFAVGDPTSGSNNLTDPPRITVDPSSNRAGHRSHHH